MRKISEVVALIHTFWTDGGLGTKNRRGFFGRENLHNLRQFKNPIIFVQFCLTVEIWLSYIRNLKFIPDKQISNARLSNDVFFSSNPFTTSRMRYLRLKMVKKLVWFNVQTCMVQSSLAGSLGFCHMSRFIIFCVCVIRLLVHPQGLYSLPKNRSLFLQHCAKTLRWILSKWVMIQNCFDVQKVSCCYFPSTSLAAPSPFVFQFW